MAATTTQLRSDVMRAVLNASRPRLEQVLALLDGAPVLPVTTTVTEAAKYIGVTRQTVYAWIDQGLLTQITHTNRLRMVDVLNLVNNVKGGGK